jgi:hypothetical protein
MGRRWRRFSFLGVILSFLGAAACITGHMKLGEPRTESRSVKLGDARSVRVEVKMGAGELKMAPGASDLLDAKFSYNVDAWKPVVEYSVNNGRGELTIRQRGAGTSLPGAHQEWDLRFNGTVPMEMSAELGAGRANLNLGNLSLTNFSLEIGAGETIVDLTGNWRKDLSARINGGVGRATIRLPREVGVHVNAQGGIGTINAPGFQRNGDAYVNDAYGKSHVTLNLDVQGGVGEIELELAGNSPVV